MDSGHDRLAERVVLIRLPDPWIYRPLAALRKRRFCKRLGGIIARGRESAYEV